MAKNEASVAPKERVNIKYVPATGDGKEEVELPLKQVVLGDFTMRKDETILEDRKRINIDKDNFTDVMRSMDLSLDLAVEDKLSGEKDRKLPAHLQFKSIRDFEPERVVEQVDELRKLRELRDALSALKGPLGNVPNFRKTIESVLTDEGQRAKLLRELGVESPKG
ncbi:MAG TPA: type VI secretion system contractile sheath small subunit [Stellaceae bacterium]|nr:type VI secretion system contractile sheath small subunit [Stellaceae bacterium]